MLCAFAPEAGLPVETLRKTGAAFGVGMGCMEATCGALCASEMLLGCFTWQGAPILRSAKAMHRAFTEECGASVCKDLKGLATGRVLCECDDCVRCAVKLALEAGKRQE